MPQTALCSVNTPAAGVSTSSSSSNDAETSKRTTLQTHCTLKGGGRGGRGGGQQQRQHKDQHNEQRMNYNINNMNNIFSARRGSLVKMNMGRMNAKNDGGIKMLRRI